MRDCTVKEEEELLLKEAKKQKKATVDEFKPPVEPIIEESFLDDIR